MDQVEPDGMRPMKQNAAPDATRQPDVWDLISRKAEPCVGSRRLLEIGSRIATRSAVSLNVRLEP